MRLGSGLKGGVKCARLGTTRCGQVHVEDETVGEMGGFMNRPVRQGVTSRKNSNR